jgi:hypothetical protein
MTQINVPFLDFQLPTKIVMLLNKILQRVFVVEDIDYARNSEGMRDYRNNVIFYIGRYVRFD